MLGGGNPPPLLLLRPPPRWWLCVPSVCWQEKTQRSPRLPADPFLDRSRFRSNRATDRLRRTLEGAQNPFKNKRFDDFYTVRGRMCTRCFLTPFLLTGKRQSSALPEIMLRLGRI